MGQGPAKGLPGFKAVVAGFRSHLSHECPLWPHTSDFISVCARVGQWNTLSVQDSTCRANNKSQEDKEVRVISPKPFRQQVEKADEIPLLAVLGLGAKWRWGYVPLLSVIPCRAQGPVLYGTAVRKRTFLAPADMAGGRGCRSYQTMDWQKIIVIDKWLTHTYAVLNVWRKQKQH